MRDGRPGRHHLLPAESMAAALVKEYSATCIFGRMEERSASVFNSSVLPPFFDCISTSVPLPLGILLSPTYLFPFQRFFFC